MPLRLRAAGALTGRRPSMTSTSKRASCLRLAPTLLVWAYLRAVHPTRDCHDLSLFSIFGVGLFVKEHDVFESKCFPECLELVLVGAWHALGIEAPVVRDHGEPVPRGPAGPLEAGPVPHLLLTQVGCVGGAEPVRPEWAKPMSPVTYLAALVQAFEDGVGSPRRFKFLCGQEVTRLVGGQPGTLAPVVPLALAVAPDLTTLGKVVMVASCVH
mmetsp:Transcript_71935/g.163283  ORF Transcript_71935/g.163283 Transcript_71935/m.163283 type:complete len:213 (+) Transcript_71935:134-772(+)